MKVHYLTISVFADNQLAVLQDIAKIADVTWAVIFPYKRANYREQELQNYCTNNGIRFEAYKLNHRFRNLKTIETYWRALKAVRDAKPDLVILTNFDQVYMNILALVLDKRKTIIEVHDVDNHSGTNFHNLANVGKSILFRRFHNFLTHSETQSRLLAQRHQGKSTYAIPLPMIGFRQPSLPSKTFKHSITEFLFFGNILPYKGLDLLLQAVSRLDASGRSLKLVVAGRCDDWDSEYGALVKNDSVIDPHIRFVENDEIAGFYESADFVVLPYRDTTQSGPLMISYFYNVPVIASNAAGFREFTETGVTGFEFDLASDTSLDDALAAAIDCTQAEYYRLKMAQKAYVNERFSAASIVDQYRGMFIDVIGRHRSHGQR